MLALDAGSVVPSDRLVDELWRGQPPSGAAKTLRSYISRLRRLLRPEATLTARGDGYVLELEHAWLDASRFEDLTKEGQAALTLDDVRGAAERFGDGLALWRGRALADVIDVEALALESRRLEELRLEALEGRLDAELELGLHAQLVSELERLVAEHPLRERFWRQLVLALYRCERQADALAAYRRARDLLADELGLEPGEELQRLEQAVLRHEVPAIYSTGSTAQPADAADELRRPRARTHRSRPAARRSAPRDADRSRRRREDTAGARACRAARGGLSRRSLVYRSERDR